MFANFIVKNFLHIFCTLPIAQYTQIMYIIDVNNKQARLKMKNFVFMGVDFNNLKSANFVPFYHVAYLEFKNGGCIRKDFDNLQQMVNFEDQVKYQGIQNWRGFKK